MQLATVGLRKVEQFNKSMVGLWPLQLKEKNILSLTLNSDHESEHRIGERGD